MPTALTRHPDSRGGEGLCVEAAITRPSVGLLELRYVVTGDIDGVRLPPPSAPERADELWRHTCFEAFLSAQEGAYYEFNFAPSSRWAAYRFDGYRIGMAAAGGGAPTPEIVGRSSPGRYELSVRLNIEGLPGLPLHAEARLGLSAILEDVAGNISYWATRHPAGKPDFHHPDSLVLDLPLTDSR